MKFDSTERIDDQTVRSIIREIVTNGTIILSKHAKVQMALRGYTTNDIIHILSYGNVASREFKEKNNNWVYTIEGNDLDKDSGGVVIAIVRRMTGVVITVLS